MYLPPLNVINTKKEMIAEWRGYNHNPVINANEWYDMTNLTSDLYPLLSPRKPRGFVRRINKPNGLLAHDRLCWIDGTDFVYDGVIRGQVEDSPKQLIAMGAYILVWPDKVYYNTYTDEYGKLESETSTGQNKVTCTLCRADGSAYGEYVSGEMPPESPADGALWVDTSTVPNVLKQYSASGSIWVSMPTTYIKISSPGIGTEFAAGDGVSISGFVEPHEDLNARYVLQGASDDSIVIIGIIPAAFELTDQPLTISRTIPDMDYLTESENRIWGCSSEKHEIYACKLGDPKNWNVFQGIASDSYAATVGTPGDFTGACTHGGYVMFFKEDAIHKLYGNKPANYQLMQSDVRGVQKGSEGSICIVNETLFYKSREDVCAYSTALPTGISDALGVVRYKNAVAGKSGSKYYISMADSTGSFSMFVFDSERGLWHREDDTHALYFATLGDELYYIDADTHQLIAVNGDISEYGENASMEDRVSWVAETGNIGLDSPDRKYISKLQLRVDVEDKAYLRVDVQYDSNPRWETVYRITATNTRSMLVPIIPRRCDHMRIRLVGTGVCRVYSMAKTIERGSDL